MLEPFARLHSQMVCTQSEPAKIPQHMLVQILVQMVTMVTMGGDLQPGSLADRLLTGLGQPQINP